jgi:small subunit ribosomal protein S9
MKGEKKMAETRTYATGKKKSAIARVWLQPGDGKMTINKQPADQYFGRPTLVQLIQEPLGTVDKAGAFDFQARVDGGGKAGQAAAVRHGLAKALSLLDGQMRSPLKKAGMLTRDSRVKERKKYGQPGARKRYQYSKR